MLMKQTVFERRFHELDVYKGVAILLIIFGHCICVYPINLKSDFGDIHTFVSIFNLNMFFLVSGLLFSTKDTWKTFLRKKFLRLMLPWGVFVFLSILLRTLFSSITHSAIGSVGSELLQAFLYAKYYWFLYALFLMMIVTRIVKNRYILAFMGG